MPKKKTTSRKTAKTTKKPTKKSAVTVAWEKKFYTKMLPLHVRSAEDKAKRMMRRLSSVRSSMVIRSAKYEVPCTVTLDDLREMALDAYGKPCPYSKRILTIENMVFDHIVPISKGGPSTRENLQVISKFSNAIKGSLSEEDFLLLLDCLDQLPDHIRSNVMIRLAGGKR